MMISPVNRLKRFLPTAVLLLVTCPVISRGAEVRLTKETKEGRTVYRLSNYRLNLVIEPDRGAAVTSWRDKLGGDVELAPSARPQSFCVDKFQSQFWPGEMYEGKYTVQIEKAGPDGYILAGTTSSTFTEHAARNFLALAELSEQMAGG